ncbi:TerB family tellurite resistance protein, partial [Pseudoxanthomonas sp. SGD-10]
MRIAIILVLSIGFSFQVKAQSHEAQQLLLNYEKLKQLKNMLSDMKKGYQIVSKGYNSVKSIAEGNFSIHDVFLKGLVAVNPAIKNYWRVAEIIKQQKTLVSEYKTAFNRFSNSNIFNV